MSVARRKVQSPRSSFESRLSRFIGDVLGRSAMCNHQCIDFLSPVGAVCNPGHDLSDRTGLECPINSKIYYK